MQLLTPDFENGKSIPKKFTCQGENISPTLIIHGVPEGVESLVLIMYDPDAPQGDFVHWIVWNIPKETETIMNGSLPATAVEGLNSANSNSYIGPCPPTGTHRYIFTIYALDKIFDDLDPKTTDRSKLLEGMAEHILGEAELLGLYSKG
ncbi:YbhB/YbcL family Raf kinase inhibitor-like protein [Candidatus Parcubacteria bacterium]|nr:YbhB/YbcL family Raf kinase inhibitor-like protein [Candidatus Parcubacteria bacterium]